MDIVDLYSEKQIIKVTEDKDIYDLKFKIVSYNKELIILNNYIILSDCDRNNNELICHLTKSEMEKYLDKSGSQFSVKYNDYIGRISKFYLVPKIEIIYTIDKKIDVFITINKLILKLRRNIFLSYQD